MTETVTFAHDGRGLSIVIGDGDDRKHESLLVSRDMLTAESRQALEQFLLSTIEVRDISEVAPGDVLVAGEDWTLVYGFGLTAQIRRCQRIDEFRWIEQLLREGCRLLRPNPGADVDSEVEMLRQRLFDESNLGIARATLVARRAAAASGA